MTKVTRLTLEQGGVLERRRLHLREVADDADAPLDTIGADLRAMRMRRGEDIAAISQALKIRGDYLVALENGDLQALPGRAYAIGFLRSYSEFVGLDPAASVERFKAEIAGRGEPEEASPTAFTAEDTERKLPQGWIVFVALLLIAVIWGGYYLSVSANRMLTQSVTPVPATLAQQTGIDIKPATTTTTTVVAPAPSPAPQIAVVHVPATPLVTPHTAPTVKPTPAPAAAPAQTVVASIQPQTPPAATEPALPAGNSYGLGNKNSRVTLRIHRPTRVLVQGPRGNVFINRTLRPGDTYRAPNLVGLVLTTGDASGVEVILDGAPVGRAGGGAANGVSLNPQDIMDRASHAGPG